MLVLGLDPSLTSYGYSLHNTQASAGADRCVLKGQLSTPASQLFLDRYITFREFLRSLIQEHKPDKIGIESPIFGEIFSPGAWGLFLYSNEAFKEEKMDVVYFSPPQIKMHARESLKRPDGWKMMKGDMVSAAKEDTGIKTKWSHDAADAFLCARLAGRFWEYLSGSILITDLTPTERKLFTEVHTFSKGKNAGQTEKTGIIFRENERFYRWSQTVESGPKK